MKSDYKNRVPEGPSRWGKNLGKVITEHNHRVSSIYSIGAGINYHLNVKAF